MQIPCQPHTVKLVLIVPALNVSVYISMPTDLVRGKQSSSLILNSGARLYNQLIRAGVIGRTNNAILVRLYDVEILENLLYQSPPIRDSSKSWMVLYH